MSIKTEAEKQASVVEKRSLILPVENRASEDGKVTVAGYAAIFGQEADIAGYFKEVIARGAFTNTLLIADVRALFDHDTAMLLGRTTAGTLRLSEDVKGLAVEIDLPDTSVGRDVKTLIERGDINGMSFGFRVTKQEWDETGEIPVRTIHEVELYEVSIVTFPAYDGTSIAMRSLDDARNELKRKNFNAESHRFRLKADLDFRTRGVGNKA